MGSLTSTVAFLPASWIGDARLERGGLQRRGLVELDLGRFGRGRGVAGRAGCCYVVWADTGCGRCCASTAAETTTSEDAIASERMKVDIRLLPVKILTEGKGGTFLLWRRRDRGVL